MLQVVIIRDIGRIYSRLITYSSLRTIRKGDVACFKLELLFIDQLFLYTYVCVCVSVWVIFISRIFFFVKVMAVLIIQRLMCKTYEREQISVGLFL